MKSELHTNALEAGFQYVKYKMANGSSLELVHNPLYDDREINFEIDEVTGYPVESQRITFLDFTGESKKSNIKIMNKKDSFSFTYVEGTYRDWETDRKSTRLNSSHSAKSRMPSSA